MSQLETIARTNLGKYFSPALDDLDAVFCVNPDLQLIYANAAAKRLFSTKDIESSGRRATALMPERYGDPFAHTVDGLLNEGRSYGRESLRMHGLDSNGAEFSMSVSLCVLALEGESAVIALVRDTKERTEQQTIARKERAYHKLIENLPLSILIIDADLNLAAANQQTAAFYGLFDPEQVPEMSFAELVAPEDKRQAIADLKSVLKTGRSRSVEYQMMSAAGERAPVKFSLSGILSEAEKPREIMAIAREPGHSGRPEEQPANLLWFERVIADTAHVVQSIIKAEDPFIADHQERVAKLAAALAEDLGLPKDKIEGIYVAANFHDIGNFFVPTRILSKPSGLTSEERRVIQRHVNPGHDILNYIKFPWPVAKVVLQHHERLDGSGYPGGIKDDEIIFESRILAVADVMEAMASDRPYRAGLGIDAALNEISQKSGILYDSSVVHSCVRLFKERDFRF